MQFCDDCGSMMKADGDRMVCADEDCGATSGRDRETEAEFVSTDSQRFDDVIETSEETDVEGKPTTSDVRCPECENEKAYYALQQTASADEPPTRFFKCTECGHRWRGYN
ncbi:transcription factor S [Natrononativus amylolyticus]|uniref:transcription factor S n=1 Tax=Natrononativus amylolyticus TaxID=2963434 RepID=UPI0020CD6C43|nr:transcription factor S [Natrononativus amylolyticus]